jgi:imidazolonepropionase-like amidohydrolase
MTQLLISAGRVLLGPATNMISPGAVLVTDDTITATGHPDDLAPRTTSDAQRLSFPDATLLPGLIDAHVHLALDASADILTPLHTTGNTALLDAMGQRAVRLLDQGITTARDLGDRDYLAVALRERILAGAQPGPRILTSGAPLTPPGGHCWFLGGEVHTPTQIRDLVRRHADAGVDCIKVMISGGHITPGSTMWQSQFSLEQQRIIVAEASAVGLPVAAHAHGTTSIAEAARLGVATIEHCTWMARDGERSVIETNDETLAMIAEKAIAVCPTISPSWRLKERAAPGYLATKTRLLRWYAQHNIRVIAGTDAGVSQRSVFDGYLHHLELFDTAGIPRTEIIDIATSTAAAALGVNTGILAPGRGADLLVVDGDPLADLAALRNIRLVVTRGQTYTPRHHPVAAP